MGLVLLGGSALAAPATSAREQSLLARVTVYWASGGGGSDHWTRNHQAATSVRLRVGHCAVDPQRIPYGSKVLFPDATLVAVDTGKHVVSRKAARKSGRTATERNALVIDRFFETKSQALKWARTHPHFMTVRILPPTYRPNSPAASVVASTTSPNQRLLAYNPSAAPALTAGGAVTPPAGFSRQPVSWH